MTEIHTMSSTTADGVRCRVAAAMSSGAIRAGLLEAALLSSSTEGADLAGGRRGAKVHPSGVHNQDLIERPAADAGLP